MGKDKIDIKLLGKHIVKEDNIKLPIEISEDMEEYLKDIKILFIRDSIDVDINLKDFNFKEGRALYEQRIILVRAHCDVEVIYHEIGHFLCTYLHLARNANYATTFLSELIYMYEIDGRNRYILTPTEYYPQAFAMYCIRSHFFKTRCPRTYNLLSESGMIYGELVTKLSSPKSYFSFLINRATGSRVSVKNGDALTAKMKDVEGIHALYNLVAYSDKVHTEKTYNDIVNFCNSRGITL